MGRVERKRFVLRFLPGLIMASEAMVSGVKVLEEALPTRTDSNWDGVIEPDRLVDELYEFVLAGLS